MSNRALDGVAVLLIDGNNLLHRVSGSVEPGAQRLLIARLRGAIPPTLPTVLMLDGHAAQGTRRAERIGRGFEIRHAGSISADDALIRLIADSPPGERHAVTIVSDDRSLVERARHLGARTQRLAWLEGVMATPNDASTPEASIGRKGGVRPSKPDAAADDHPDRPPWKPGRGATRKRGNPRRLPR